MITLQLYLKSHYKQRFAGQGGGEVEGVRVVWEMVEEYLSPSS